MARHKRKPPIKVGTQGALVCPSHDQQGVCLQQEACHHRKPGQSCPYECDACRDVSPDIDDEGLCENCREMV